MIELKQLKLTNVVTYDSAVLPFKRKGLTFIYGRNLDAGNSPDKSNGAGKSLLLTMLAETCMNQSPLLSGRTSNKDGFFRAGAEVSVEWNNYRVTKSLKGKTLKYELDTKQGDAWESLNARTNDYALERLNELFPISAEEFFSLYYVDSTRPSILQRGSHADRLAMISALCRFDGFDDVLLQLKSRVKEVKLGEAKLGEVISQLDALLSDSPDLPEGGLAELSKQLATLRGDLQRLAAKRQEATALLHTSTICETLGDNFKQVTEAGADSVDGLKDLRCATVKKINAITKVVSACSEALAVRTELRVAEGRLAELHKRVSDSGFDLTSCKQRMKELKAAEELNQAILREIGVHQSKRDHYAARIKPFNPDLVAKNLKGVDVKTRLSKVETLYGRWCGERLRLAGVLRAFDNLVSGGAEGCPLCGSAFSGDADLVRAQLTEQLEQAQVKEEGYANLNDWLKAYKESEEARQEKEYHDSQISDRESRLVKVDVNEGVRLQKAMHDIEAYQKEQREVDQLRIALKDTPDIDIDKTRTRLERAKSLLKAIDAVEPYFQVLLNSGEGYDTQQLSEGIAKLDSRISSLNQRVQQLATEYGLASSFERKKEGLLTRKGELEQVTKDAPVLRALADAYGSKGLRNIQTKRVCDTLARNLNVYAPLMFAEPVTFSIEVDETHCHILTTKRVNGELVTCDIRRLSGAESRAFNLILPLAFLPLVPESRRLNILALDEPTANMDQPAIDLFLNSYCPKARELAHVIVLSPISFEEDHGGDVWQVTRQNGKSTLTLVKEGFE